MMLKYKTGGVFKIFACLFFVISILFAEDPDITRQKICEHSKNIDHACKQFDVNPEYLKAIIYVERVNNYNWQDAYFDDYLAKKGQNSSIGFCQIKMKTAYWIERQLADRNSEFYPGKKYEKILSVSQSPEAIIEKLNNDTINLLYAAAYLQIIQSYWQKSGFSISDRPDILATIYSYGIFNRETGEPLLPNQDPKANKFGQKVCLIVEMLIYFAEDTKIKNR